MTYIIEVVRWEPEDNQKRLGEYTFVEKPLVGDHLRLSVDYKTEVAEVLRYFHVATTPEFNEGAPRSSNLTRRVQLMVKTIDPDTYKE